MLLDQAQVPTFFLGRLCTEAACFDTMSHFCQGKKTSSSGKYSIFKERPLSFRKQENGIKIHNCTALILAIFMLLLQNYPNLKGMSCHSAPGP